MVMTLNWLRVDSEGNSFARGKRYYYAIIIRGVPEDHPKDCVIELYATNKALTAFEIKVLAESRRINPISRSVFWGNLPPITKITESGESMKRTAERRENESFKRSF